MNQLTCTDEYSYKVWEAPGAGKDLGEPVPPRFPRVPIAGTTTLAALGFIFFYKTPLQPGEDPDERANRVEIRDMRCRGAMRGDESTFGDEVLCFTICNTTDFTSPCTGPDSLPVTTRQDVLISNIEVDGYATDAFPIFGNACVCITIAGGLVLTDNYDLNGSVDGELPGRTATSLPSFLILVAVSSAARAEMMGNCGVSRNNKRHTRTPSAYRDKQSIGLSFNTF